MKAFCERVLKLKLIFVLLVSVFLCAACDEVEPEWKAEHITELSSEYIRAVAVDHRGDIVIAAGVFDHSGESMVERYRVVKYNEAGDLLWSYMDTSTSRSITGFKIGTDNSIYLSGDTGESNYVLKLTENGEIDWVNSGLPGSWLTGGLAVSSTTVYMTNRSTYAFDAETGENLWKVDGELRTTDLILDSNENVYIAGYYHRASYDSNGNERWLESWEDSGYGKVSLAIDADDTVFAVGRKTGTSDIHLMKMDNSDGLIVALAVQTVNSCGSPLICIDQNGDVTIAASGEDEDLGRRVVKYTNDLSVIWSKEFESGAQTFDLNDMIVSNSGDIYLSGGDITTKVDSNGSFIQTVLSGSSYSDNFLALDANEEYLYIATEKEYSNDNNILLLKYLAK